MRFQYPILLAVLQLWVFAVAPVSADTFATHEIQFLRDFTAAGDAGPLSLPSDVAVHNNRVFVVDGGNHRVVVFDKQGEFRFVIGTEGEGSGQFRDPIGIGVDAKGLIHIADRGNHRIQIFTADGRYQNSFPVISNDKPVRPIDVAVGPEDGEIYVTGNDNHRLMVFSSQGQLLREWGGSGLGQGEFRYPATLAVLQDYRIAVVDILNTRIQVFDRQGNFSLEIGEWGVLPGQLFRPKGIALDTEGRVYISDSYMNLIQVYTDTGVFEHVLRIKGVNRVLQSPSGMTIDVDNLLYVAEMLENRVSVYRLNP